MPPIGGGLSRLSCVLRFPVPKGSLGPRGQTLDIPIVERPIGLFLCQKNILIIESRALDEPEFYCALSARLVMTVSNVCWTLFNFRLPFSILEGAEHAKLFTYRRKCLIPSSIY